MRRCTGCAILALMLGLTSCAHKTLPPPKGQLWPTLPLQQVPDFMHGTLYERVRFTGLEEAPVYGYSLVVNLHNTGDSSAPSMVRDYIIKQMLLRGFDSYVTGTYANVSPEQMLRDKRVALVEVEGRIPVGARQGQSFDVIVRAMPRNSTKSLAHGDLYECDLSDIGLIDPQGIDAHLQAYTPGGPVFVNPAYALTEGTAKQLGSPTALRVGTVLNGGVVRFDRPINLEIREPQYSTARLIEQLISQRWLAPTQLGTVHGDKSDLVAKAENQGLVLVYVPPQYKGDWKHFLGVVSHLYLNQSPAFQAGKLRQLVARAHQPNAPLADISFCWEAMGAEALPMFEPLISDPNPDVAFAAARAAAFLDDEPAKRALVDIALDPAQHNQLEAVRALGELPDSPEVDHMIAQLLDSDRADVRVAAYRLLIASRDLDQESADDSGGQMRHHYGILTYNIAHRFLLDIVPSEGPPMIYATSTGVPRIAVIGHRMALSTPVTFTAMDMRLSITSSDGTNLLTMFYRDPLSPDTVKVETHNDLPEILARLGGEGPDDSHQFDLSFGDVVAVAQQLVAGGQVYGVSLADNSRRQCTFELEHPLLETDEWTSIPTDNPQGRPQGDAAVVTAPARTVRAGG
ncbi:MAG TPA: flagellar basal body P-ring protein FlgI [Tepidisphaeraceae bacterium]|jgi:flagellar basal body P-ring protein FlgI|nr:flagellar basal body P-ring protein FlgI [Tepidisphaeraceae bacterium]